MIITKEMTHHISVWREALEAGREYEWCPIDTQENTPGVPGYLGQWLAENVIGWDMQADGSNEHCDHVTDGMVEAAVTALLEERNEVIISGAELMAVLRSYRGETVDDFQILAEEYADEHGIELVFLGGEPTANDYELWYAERGIPDGEVCAPIEGGGTLHWFNSHVWGV